MSSNEVTSGSEELRRAESREGVSWRPISMTCKISMAKIRMGSRKDPVMARF
jgi:hypothetical protein